MQFRTAQEAFWAGNFGDEYVDRNRGEDVLAANTALFARVLARAPGVHSVLELGANIGMNLVAIRRLLPDAQLSAVEINEKAAEPLREIQGCTVHATSLLDYEPESEADLVLAKLVLIHVNPDELCRAYRVLYQSTRRYICIAEYYNPNPAEVTYRGHSSRLFKRDFAGEMLDTYRDLRLVDYGFIYHRDMTFAQDDVTWFLLEKTGI